MGEGGARPARPRERYHRGVGRVKAMLESPF
jgi:hypothetical protein